MSVVRRMNRKYQRQEGLLSRLASVTKDLGTVMKRTHLKITTVSEEVTYPLIVEQRTLTYVCMCGIVLCFNKCQ